MSLRPLFLPVQKLRGIKLPGSRLEENTNKPTIVVFLCNTKDGREWMSKLMSWSFSF